MRNIALSLLLSTLFSFGIMAQETATFTLEQAIKYAQEHHLSIQNAKYNIEDAEGQITERRAFGIPQVNGEVSYDYYFKVPTSVLPAQFEDIIRAGNGGELPPDYSPRAQFLFRNNFNLGLSFNAMVFDGSYFAGLRAARVFKDYVGQELISKEREVANQVVEAYLPALLIAENILILDKNIANLEKMLMEARETYKAGFIEQLDVDRLDLSLANLKVEKENLFRQKELALNLLKFSMGYPMNETLDVADQLDDLLEEASNEVLAGAIDYYNRPEYKVAEYGIRLNELNIDLYKSGYWPSIRALGSYQYGYQGNQLFSGDDGFWVPTALAGLRLNIPIFDGFEKKAKVERAKIGLAIAQNQKQELERVISLEVANARTAYVNAREQVQSQERNLQLAEKIYQTTQIKYREGVGSSLELTQAEQALYQTQQNKTQALYQLLLAKKRLDIALGK